MKAFDTETINRPGYGQACLLIKGDNFEQKIKEFPKDFSEIFDFLKGESYFAYNAAFDIRAITHPVFTNESVIEDLAIYGVARYKNILLEYIPNKYFCARKMRSEEKFEVWDLYQYYDTSLRRASDKYLGGSENKLNLNEADYQNIDKLLRGHRRNEIIEYAKRDVALTYRLWQNLKWSLEACDIMSALKDKYYSGGYIALKYLKKNLKIVAPDAETNALFARGFYGGFMDYKYLGLVKDLYYYDIKSAYPSQVKDLYSLEGAQLHRHNGAPKDLENILYGVFDVVVNMPKEYEFGFLPVRSEIDGVETIIYPVGRFRTYCGYEALKTLRRWRIKHEVIESVYYTGSKRKIFEDLILRLYEERKDPQKNLIVKKILNSMYGKFAERREPQEPLPERLAKFFPRKNEIKSEFGTNANLAYASHITEATRLKIWEAAQKFCGVYFATDGLFTMLPLTDDLIGDNLGDFSFKGKCDAIIFGNGKYRLIFEDGRIDDRFRGFRGASEIINNLLKCKTLSMSASIFTAQSFKEYAKSIERSDFNVLKNFQREITLNERKRVLKKMPKCFSDFGRQTYDSEPYILDLL